MVALGSNFRERVTRSLQEEEMDVYILTLHYANENELQFFNANDRKRIREILETLIKDTKHHAESLQLILEISYE